MVRDWSEEELITHTHTPRELFSRLEKLKISTMTEEPGLLLPALFLSPGWLVSTQTRAL